MNFLHDAYVALLSGLTTMENGKIKWFKYDENILITIIDPAKEKCYIEYDNGDKSWFQDNQLHREDGPAIEWADGSMRWYQNGILHRLDGPAVVWTNGPTYWYINGKHLTEEEFNRIINEPTT